MGELIFNENSDMPEVMISPELKSRCPKLRLGCIEANVLVNSAGEGLFSEIRERLERIQQSLKIEDIARIPAVEASRKAYRACGKDPARYRLSAEALLRRVILGKALYQINNVVDQLNLVSVTGGFSIGGYDAGKIKGNIVFGMGLADEPYEGIGRGVLNIENLPVFRDDAGAFGTPTSDSKRTEVTRETNDFLMIIIDFGADDQLETSMQLAVRLLNDHCSASSIREFDIG